MPLERLNLFLALKLKNKQLLHILKLFENDSVKFRRSMPTCHPPFLYNSYQTSCRYVWSFHFQWFHLKIFHKVLFLNTCWHFAGSHQTQLLIRLTFTCDAAYRFLRNFPLSIIKTALNTWAAHMDVSITVGKIISTFLEIRKVAKCLKYVWIPRGGFGVGVRGGCGYLKNIIAKLRPIEREITCNFHNLLFMLSFQWKHIESSNNPKPNVTFLLGINYLFASSQYSRIYI